jgi:hypothetical protein
VSLIIRSPAGIRNVVGDEYYRAILELSFIPLMVGIKKGNVTKQLALVGRKCL